MKFIKKIKNYFKPSVKSQIEKHTIKNPEVEHAFVKVPGEKIRNVSLESKMLSVVLDSKKINEYLSRNNLKREQIIHTHVDKPNSIHMPSVTDLIKIPIKELKNIEVVSITNIKGKEIGRIVYNYTPKNKKFINMIKELNRYIDLGSKQVYEGKITKEQFTKNYNFLMTEHFDLQKMEFSKKIKKNQKDWNGRDYLQFLSEMGFNIKIRAMQKDYKFDVELLRFNKK